MTRKSIWITVIVAVILLFSLFKLYEVFHRPLTHRLNADLQMLGLIDLDNIREVDLHGIMNGEDGILVVDHATTLYQSLIHKIPQATHLTPEEVFSLNNLHLFDRNGDGIITAKDTIFAHLFIIKFFNNGEQSSIKSLSASGIKAISITNTTPTGNHVVIMNDDTQHTLIGTNKLEKNESN